MTPILTINYIAAMLVFFFKADCVHCKEISRKISLIDDFHGECKIGKYFFIYLPCVCPKNASQLFQVRFLCCKKYRKAEVPCVLRQCTVVFAWKCCLFCLCNAAYVEFHFQLRCLVSFLVKHQLWSGCHSEKSSKK